MHMMSKSDDNIGWKWRPGGSRPDQALVVCSRTQYAAEHWDKIRHTLEPAHSRILNDPRVLGLAVRVDDDEHVTWSESAWPDYDTLKSYVCDQVEWLSRLAQDLKPDIVQRHNAYRIVEISEVPFPWRRVCAIVENVRKISPLEADAFPELSKALGLTSVTRRDLQ